MSETIVEVSAQIDQSEFKGDEYSVVGAEKASAVVGHLQEQLAAKSL